MMKNLLARYAKDESGATAIEYGLIAALVAVVIIAALQLMSTELNLTFGHIEGELRDARGGGGGS